MFGAIRYHAQRVFLLGEAPPIAPWLAAGPS